MCTLLCIFLHTCVRCGDNMRVVYVYDTQVHSFCRPWPTTMCYRSHVLLFLCLPAWRLCQQRNTNRRCSFPSRAPPHTHTHRRFMPDAVHWRALDPLDIQPDEWLSDVGKYNILCSMGNIKVPTDGIGAKRLSKALKRVHSRAACDNFSFNAR